MPWVRCASGNVFMICLFFGWYNCGADCKGANVCTDAQFKFCVSSRRRKGIAIYQLDVFDIVLVDIFIC